MSKLKLPLVILFGILSFSACEKDDICIDADTPMLVIRFVDVMDTASSKDVQNLVVIGLDEMGFRDTIPNVALDSIILPLRPNKTSTSFILRRQLDVLDSLSVNTVTFTYEPKEIFKSRACGYVVNYADLSASVKEIDPDSLWIQQIIIDSTLIENSAATHVKILH